jgi:hypothetical protein
VGALATDGRWLVSAFHGISFLAGAGPILPEAGEPTQNYLLKNRVLNPPQR